MADEIRSWFTSAPGLERLNIYGLIVMAVGILMVVVGAMFKQQRKSIIIRLVGLAVCMIGTIVAISVN